MYIVIYKRFMKKKSQVELIFKDVSRITLLVYFKFQYHQASYIAFMNKKDSYTLFFFFLYDL